MWDPTLSISLSPNVPHEICCPDKTPKLSHLLWSSPLSFPSMKNSSWLLGFFLVNSFSACFWQSMSIALVFSLFFNPLSELTPSTWIKPSYELDWELWYIGPFLFWPKFFLSRFFLFVPQFSFFLLRSTVHIDLPFFLHFWNLFFFFLVNCTSGIFLINLGCFHILRRRYSVIIWYWCLRLKIFSLVWS